MVEVAEVENPEFKWGKKRGIGGKKKDVQFYESFTYDGVEYTLYDCVYMYKEDEPEPYIGKLIKIWEHSDKTKKVKVLWFFRPCEIAKFLGNDQTLENELFLACGEGVGLVNINPLEAIAGKCNVVCISKDSRNPQPSNEELQMSDFVFCRTFDVGHHQILDKMDEKVAGIEGVVLSLIIKFLLNRVDHKKSSSVVKLDSIKKEDGMIAVAGDERVNSSKDVHEEHKTAKAKSLLVKEPTSSINIESGGRAKSNGVQENISSDKTTLRSEVKENAHLKVPTVNHRSSSGEGEHSRISVDFSEVANTTDRLEKTSRGKTNLRSKVEENADSEALTLGQKSSLREKVASDRTTSSSKAYSEIREGKGAQVPISKFKVKEELKSTKDRSELDNRASKRVKLDDSAKLYDDNEKNSVQKLGCDFDQNSAKEIVPAIATEDKSKLKLAVAKESHGIEKGSPKWPKVDEKLVKLSSGKFSRDSAIQTSNIDKKTDNQVSEVTPRQIFEDRSSWFKESWEDRLQGAHEQGKLVLLENLDPSCTKAEVEDIIWHAFEKVCSAKMVQRNATSSPHSGQAYVIFKKKEEAEMVITKLDEGCLLLSNGRRKAHRGAKVVLKPSCKVQDEELKSGFDLTDLDADSLGLEIDFEADLKELTRDSKPLIGSSRAPCFTKKQSTFLGHIALEKLKIQMPREMREAVSTSHCSQPNTLEYDMAMEWCLQQERSERALKVLYKRQGEELRRLKAKLKSK
ncbi:hypothetical protein JRO89_XS03G0266700 [Xanthoceras sorbifolium]|uniref:BAH domain-containing protein n=1 Tax=Xanthoceras sorbifolium TaxID=99658 RepID=A0ABQ8IC50_9ROSI|nr:hypothetical protein JRO89_XS03G0266700 [Xanthoceras sorbifolium]